MIDGQVVTLVNREPNPMLVRDAASDGPGLKLTGDFSMESPLSTPQLVSSGGNWVELSRSQS